MDGSCDPVLGAPITAENLSVARAHEFVGFLKKGINPFARIQECRSVPIAGGGSIDVVVLDVDVEVPQRPSYDIRPSETIAVRFFDGDLLAPDVLALRSDFPMVPHLNLREEGLPRSLCLYDRPFHEVALDWTPASLVERIREWLALTAIGELHAGDQPLEPLFLGSMADLVLPEGFDWREDPAEPRWISLNLVPTGPGTFTAITRTANAGDVDGAASIALAVRCSPRTHGVIHRMPGTLLDLHAVLSGSGNDLLDVLRRTLRSWMMGGGDDVQRLFNVRLILLLALPKTRTPDGPVETTEYRAFATLATIAEVGVDIGVWELNDGKTGLLVPADTTRCGRNLSLVPLNPRPAFSRSLAALANGLPNGNPVAVTAVGAGALGSQVAANLVRSGFGQWTIIDGDVLLPHNLARHALYGFALGFPKAMVLAETFNQTIAGEPIAKGIVADVIAPGVDAESVERSLSEAELILDMSASVAVARHLSRDVQAIGRRISLFLNPSGTALTILSEDKERRIRLDTLEMQLYRAIIENSQLDGLLSRPGQLRTGQSCRDVSVQLPQELVALHAAIGSRAVREAAESDHARITVWRVDSSDYGVDVIEVGVSEPSEHLLGEWTALIDQHLRQKLIDVRRSSLPRETGGVFIGTRDMLRKIIHIVDTIPSPPDSEELPTSYIRGFDGLGKRLAEISTATDGMVGYLGEWHSHPARTAVSPSGADFKVLEWITDTAAHDGTYGVMGIVGDDARLGLFLGDRPSSGQ